MSTAACLFPFFDFSSSHAAAVFGFQRRFRLKFHYGSGNTVPLPPPAELVDISPCAGPASAVSAPHFRPVFRSFF